MVIWLFVLKEYIVLATTWLCEDRARMHVNKGILFIRPFGQIRRGKFQYLTPSIMYELEIGKRVSIQPDEI
jgi:hypothetical protein